MCVGVACVRVLGVLVVVAGGGCGWWVRVVGACDVCVWCVNVKAKRKKCTKNADV